MAEQQVSFEGELKTLLKTGKVIFGARKAIKYVKLGKVKMVIIASTLRGDLKEDITYYAKLSNIPIYEYKGSGWDLGTLCGKPFMISTISVLDEGDSKILDIIKER
ncbi:50S ribosomal protein L30e [Sulfolobus tengchongensis]|uniref:Large ribosomal subunit protein eL30 n=1 Tax=Sulfolobus tengchongensis TaxID=207809 RepID=A0AAX4KYR6_9CREN